MESTRRRRFSIFGLVFILLGVSGVNISGAATTKYKVPSAPTNVEAVGGLEKATLTWKAPSSNGGIRITAYKVTYYPGAKIHMCNSSALRCVVDIPNPNKPSSKPPSVWYYFTVAAVNSVGMGPVSIVGHARVLIKFRATVYVAPKYGADIPTPTPAPTPTPTINAVPAPSPSTSPATAPIACGSGSIPQITTFDGSYRGQATVTITRGSLSTNSTIPTTFTILNGRGTGSADIWKVDACVTDSTGGGTVVVSSSLYGAITFTIKLTIDSATHQIGGNGKGVNTFSVPVFGDIAVEFVLNVSTNTNQ
jgi:hypothetical protein